jgi:2-oxoglutarate ferredoxin oxidoreductase subunit gamma
MHHELIIAGFGGQGVLLAGQILAWAANHEGKSVVWSPSYGPEMRGGSSHCTVIISSQPVGSPVVARPDTAIAMDESSLTQLRPPLVPRVKPGGLLLLNSSLVRSQPGRDDVSTLGVPVNGIAEQVGDVRSANVVMLGMFMACVPLVDQESIFLALNERWRSQPRLLDLNQRALKAGMEYSKTYSVERSA